MGHSILQATISLIVIVAIVLVIRKAFVLWRTNKQWTVKLILLLVTSVILIPFSVLSLYSSVESIANPTLPITITHKKIRLIGTETTGTLKGKTSPNTKVQLKESDGYDDYNKITTSDHKGKFEFSNMPDDSTFKLTLPHHRSNPEDIKITTSNIPVSAYTELNVNNEDADIKDLELNNNENNKVVISGKSEKGSTIRIEDVDNDYKLVEKPQQSADGSWSATLDGPGTSSTDKKEKNYDVVAKVKGKLESDSHDITIKNTNYVKQKKINPDSSKNSQDDSSDSSTSPKDGFKRDMNAYLTNQYPDVSMTYSKGTVTFNVPDEVSILNKQELKAYFKPINDRIFTFASANDMKSAPTMIAQMSDGTVLARSSLFGGVKVYVQK